MEAKSITELKAAFIRSQIRLLSTPLQPSPSWRELGPESEESDLNEKLVQDVVSKVNEKIKLHNRMVFSSQSQRHVAEQIEQLHWNSVTATETRADLGAVVVKRDAELTNTQTIESLPENHEDLFLHSNQSISPADAARYLELYDRLTELSKVRDNKKRKLEQYQQLQQSLQPFEEPQANIQPNLVTKGGELSKELERMRVLLARVTDRVADIKTTSSDSVLRTDRAVKDSEKLQNVLGLM